MICLTMSSIAKALPITAKPNIRKCAHQQQALRQPAAPGTNIRPKSQLQIELQVCRARLRGKQEIPILSWVGRAWSMTFASVVREGENKQTIAGVAIVLQVLKQPNEKIYVFEDAATVTETLQNVNSLEADYVAFIRGIEAAADIGALDLQVFSESKMLVDQMLGKVKKPAAGSTIWQLRGRAIRSIREMKRFSVQQTKSDTVQAALEIATQAADGDRKTGVHDMQGRSLVKLRKALPLSAP